MHLSQTPLFFIIAVFKKVVSMSCVSATVDTVLIPRLATKYTVTQWPWL